MALAFPVEIRPGGPVYEQIVYATKRALAQGILKPGDRFPAVRTLSQDLGINPNTVQRAVAELTALGLLEVHSGQGCYVAASAALPKAESVKALAAQIESLVVEASRLGLNEADVRKALADVWRRLKRE